MSTGPMAPRMASMILRILSSLLKIRNMRKMRSRRRTLRPLPLPPLRTYAASKTDKQTMMKSNQFQADEIKGLNQWPKMLASSSTT